MKRTVRIVSLVLVLVMALSMGANAATVYNVAPKTDFYSDVMIVPYNGDTPVKFDTGLLTDATTPICIFENISKLRLTFTVPNTTEDFMVFLLKDGEVPQNGNIKYINQVAGAASHSFDIYPSELEAGNYNICVSSKTGGYKNVGSIKVVATGGYTTPDYQLGDANLDGVINIYDAQWVLRKIVGQITDNDYEDLNLVVADTVSGSGINVYDAQAIMRYIVGQIISF